MNDGERPHKNHGRGGSGADRVVRVIVLGSTGSIGTQTLDVIEHLNAMGRSAQSTGEEGEVLRYEVVGLAAGSNEALLAAQARRFGVRDVALACGVDGDQGEFDKGVRIRRGEAGGTGQGRGGGDAAERLVREVDADVVVAAMVGVAGLAATLAAVRLGRDVALANKETLVAAGALVVPAARASGSRLLPVDSEHCAAWQCLAESAGWDGAGGGGGVPPMVCGASVAKVILTASGGPFRTRTREETYHATPAEALKHPTWTMGAKVTVDSASLMNKALEVIEAHWLFGLEPERIGVVVHPQSIVHAIVEYVDGNVIAHLSPADMRCPIQYALTHPQRKPGRVRAVNLATVGKLEFFEPDRERFPALDLAGVVMRRGGTAGAVFNAANEEAVNAFLRSGRIAEEAGERAGGTRRTTEGSAEGIGPGTVTAARTLAFGRIGEMVAAALDGVGISALRDMRDVEEADAEARRFVRSRLGE